MTEDSPALDPLDPPEIGPIQGADPAMDPLALDPLSPIAFGPRRPPAGATRDTREPGPPTEGT
jgi:hypothetical protein